jgi:hypothetical protein
MKNKFENEGKLTCRYAKKEDEMNTSALSLINDEQTHQLKSSLLRDSKSRNDDQKARILTFLQKDSKFKLFFPEGSQFSTKDLESICDGCRLRRSSRGEVLMQL